MQSHCSSVMNEPQQFVILHRDSATSACQFALPSYASAEKTSTNMVIMVCHAGGLPVVIRDTAPSMIS